MRLLHIADLHIGKRVCEFSMLEDQRHVLSQVIDMLGAHEADALLVAGDLYDKATPSAEAVALVDWFLSEAAETGVPAIVIPGNHDSAERVAYAGAMLARQGIHVAPVYDGTIRPVELADDDGPVRIWPIPFVRPATVRHFFPDEDISDYTDALRVVVGSCALDRSVRNVAVAHQFVTAGAMSPELSDSEVSVGGLDNVDAGVFSGFDYVALGHIHRPQRIGSDTVRYAGSILKYSFSEALGSKSAVLVELGAPGADVDGAPGADAAEAGESDAAGADMARAGEGHASGARVSCELLPLEPLHDLRRIRGPLEALVAPDVVAAADAEDYLQVVLTDENPEVDAVARLRASYPNVMGIEYDNARTRAAGLAGAEAAPDADASSPLELFEEFFERQNGTALSDAQRDMALQGFERIGVM